MLLFCMHLWLSLWLETMTVVPIIAEYVTLNTADIDTVKYIEYNVTASRFQKSEGRATFTHHLVS